MPRSFARVSGWVAVIAGALCAPSFAAAPNWTFDAYIKIPFRNTLFLAQDAQGNLYATTFNNSPNADTVRAYKISQPDSATPQVTEIDQAQVPTFRGYSGITTDDTGNVFLSVDAGDSGASYIKKLLHNGQPDTSFGSNSAIMEPGTRFQGLAVAGNKLITAMSWGRIAVFDTASGKKIGETAPLPTSAPAITIRDIALVPATQEILGIDRDTVYVFTGGTLDNPAGYAPKALVQGQGRQTNGQAIYYHAPTDRIYYTRTGLGHLGSALKSTGVAEVIQTVGTNPGGPLSDPADAVISPDGNTMFVSDLRGPAIMRYRSAGAGSELAAAPAAVPSSAPSLTPMVPPGPAIAPEITPPAALPQIVSASATVPPIPTSNDAAATTNIILPVPAKDQALASAPSMPLLQGQAIPMAGGAVDGPQQGGSDPAHMPEAPGSAPTLSQPTGAPAAVEPPPTPVVTSTGTPNWLTGDLRRALSKAFAEKRRLVAFFTSPESDLAKAVEAEIFERPGFAATFPDALWLRLSIGVDRADIERYSVFRYPTVIIFTPNGQEAKRLTGRFTADEFTRTYSEAGEIGGGAGTRLK